MALVVCLCGLATCDRAGISADAVEPIILEREGLRLTVDPTRGGRITSLTFGGTELLNTFEDSTGFLLGSTAWPSPQRDWGWPPPAALDREPYTVQRVEEHSILLISAPDSLTGLVLQKRYRLGPDSDLGLTYWITNRGDSLRRVAAWEVTRLPYRGEITFFSDSIRVSREGMAVVDTVGNRAKIYFDERHEQSVKVFASLDSVPVAYHLDNLTLEKYTAVLDLYRTAPEQAPLEVYLDPERRFAELELQGDYRQLSYGQTATLRTRWVIKSSK